MKTFIWLLTAVNLYFGGNTALNALGILRTSKYSKGATIAYAITFLAMGAFGAYTAWTSSNLKLGLWIALGPWLLLLVVMFFTLILSNPIGLFLLYFPTESRWGKVAPAWARDRWAEYHNACAAWCEAEKARLSVVDDAHVSDQCMLDASEGTVRTPWAVGR